MEADVEFYHTSRDRIGTQRLAWIQIHHAVEEVIREVDQASYGIPRR
jgi:hypothetical protein